MIVVPRINISSVNFWKNIKFDVKPLTLIFMLFFKSKESNMYVKVDTIAFVLVK